LTDLVSRVIHVNHSLIVSDILKTPSLTRFKTFRLCYAIATQSSVERIIPHCQPAHIDGPMAKETLPNS